MPCVSPRRWPTAARERQKPSWPRSAACTCRHGCRTRSAERCGRGTGTSPPKSWRSSRSPQQQGGGAALYRLARIDLAGLDPRLAGATFRIASDVTNPLLGPEGASRVFGPQKGADEEAVAELDAALGVFAAVVLATTGHEVALLAGAGAAGGLGAAFLAFFDSTLQRGVDVVMAAAHLSEKMVGADVVFTGEGSIDVQTLSGKTPLGVAETAAVHGVPVIAFAGRIGTGAEALYERGFTALVPILTGVCTLDEALAAGPANLERAVAMTCRMRAVWTEARR